jgi:hypothetical protein
VIHDTWATAADPIGLEIYYGGAWHDITDDLSDDGVQIGPRGRTAQGRYVDPCELTARLYNPDGRYTPTHPSSALWGLAGRGTPARFWARVGTPRLLLTGAGIAATPDSVALSVTGDIDVRARIRLDDTRVTTAVVAKWTETGNQRTASFNLDSTGGLATYSSPDGTNVVGSVSPQALPRESGWVSLRWTLDVDDGAGGHVRAWYWSDDADLTTATWTSLGSSTGTGTTSLYDSTAAWTVGDVLDLGRLSADVDAVQVRSGIAGTLVADPAFSTQTTDTTSFADAAGNTWTINDPAELTDRRYRFTGGIVSWPVRWGLKGATSSYTQVVAAGPLRRFGRNDPPLLSSYRRGVTAADSEMTGVVAYWPMEDGRGADSFASAVPGVAPLRLVGTPSLAADDASFACSTALPTFDTGAAAAGAIPYYGDGAVQVQLLLSVPAGGLAAQTRVLQVLCTGTALRWDISLTTAGQAQVSCHDQDHVAIYTSVEFSVGTVNGIPGRLTFQAYQSGSDVTWLLAWLPVGSTVGVYGADTITTATIGHGRWVAVAPDLALSGATAGHLTVQSQIVTIFALAEQLQAFAGEDAPTRAARLAGEEGLTIQVLGNDGPALGAQYPKQLLDVLHAMEDADAGMLYEPRGSDDLRYRSGRAIAANPPVLQLAYTDNLVNPMDPDEGDGWIANLVTVTREGGGGATYEVTTGPVSTQDSPDGVGRYPDAKTINCQTDAQALPAAAWLASLGTTTDPRFLRLGLDLAHPTFTTDPDLARTVAELDAGDRITITDPPTWLPPADIDQVLLGYTETISPARWKITATTAPYAPYRVIRWDTSGALLGSDGSTLSGSHAATAISLSVATPAGPLWSYGEDFDVLADGKRFTVTAIAGTSSPQTFTVTPVPDGVTRTLADGGDVVLAAPTTWGI